MDDIASGGFIEKFGLDVNLLAAQAVNFLIVLFVLSRFVFRPLLKMMRSRSAQVERGLRSAETVKKEQEQFRVWQEGARRRARAEATALLAKAEAEARARRVTLLRQAETEAEAMHDRAVTEVEKLREDTLKQAQRDVGLLAVDVAERVLTNRLSKADKEAFLRNALTEAQKHAGAAR